MVAVEMVLGRLLLSTLLACPRLFFCPPRPYSSSVLSTRSSAVVSSVQKTSSWTTPSTSAIDQANIINFTPGLRIFQTPLFMGAFIAGTIFHLGLFFACIRGGRRLSKVCREESIRSWILTTAASITMTLGSLPFVTSFLLLSPTPGRNLVGLPLLDSDSAIAFCGYFISYLILDLLLGTFYYRSLINPITGWLHHTLYIAFLTIVIQWHVQGAFMVAAVMELPTIVLALGYLNPALRSDWLFGGTFFTTRIAFHVWLVVEIHLSWPGQHQYWMLALSTFPLHVHWFSRWARGMIRRARRRGSGAGGAGMGKRKQSSALSRRPSLTVLGATPLDSDLGPSVQSSADTLVGEATDQTALLTPGQATAYDEGGEEVDDELFFDVPLQLLV